MATKPVINSVSTNSQINSAALNSALNTLAEGVAGCVSRAGTGSVNNSFTGTLDMDGNRIQNMGSPITSGDAVSVAYLNGILSSTNAAGFVTIVEEYTATAGQTVFPLVASYVPTYNNMIVFQQGARLLSTDYTETNANTITLAVGATVGDKLAFIINQPVSTTDPANIPASDALITYSNTASAAAGTATTQAGIATASANTATSQAGLASTARQAAEVAESAAITYSTDAQSAATTALTQAGIATSAASTATIQAGLASTARLAAEVAETAAELAETHAETAEANAAISEANALAYASKMSDTSVTSNTIGTGTKTFSVEENKFFTTGTKILVYQTATPANYMYGTVTAYSGPSVSISVTHTGGSGSGITDWTLTVASAGPKGLDGTGTGTVNGPATSTNGGVALFDGTDGVLLKDAGFAPQPYDADTLFADTFDVRTKAMPSTLVAVTANTMAIDLEAGELYDWTPTGAAELSAPTVKGAAVTAIRYNYASGPTLPKATYDGSAYAATGDILLLITFATGDYELVWLNKA